MSNIHPVLTMKHGREKIWREQATDEDFMIQVSELARIYSIRKAKEKAKETGKEQLRDELILFKDYKKWRENNV